MYTKNGKRHKILIRKLNLILLLKLSVVLLDTASILGTHALKNREAKRHPYTSCQQRRPNSSSSAPSFQRAIIHLLLFGKAHETFTCCQHTLGHVWFPCLLLVLKGRRKNYSLSQISQK